MPNPNPKRYTRVVSVPLTDDHLARLDAGMAAGTTRSDLIRAAIDAHLDSPRDPSPGVPDIEQAIERVLARHGIGSDTAAPADIPEGWALAGIRTGVLRELERPALRPTGLADALAVVFRAAESGELRRDDIVPLVAERWNLAPGDRLQYDDGQLFREKAPARPRRSVATTAE